MLGGNSEDLQKIGLILGAGGGLGYFIAKKYNKSKTLGVILGVGVTLGSLYAFKINVRDIFATKTKDTQLGQKLESILETTIDVNTIPKEFTVKSDGYNTKYFKGGGGVFSYYKKPYRLDGASGVQSINIEVDEFIKAYNKFLQQPK